ncbi:MAG: hypothetical protein WC489_06200 [Patescibacteria group bacterium]|jgi:hypothetical protein
MTEYYVYAYDVHGGVTYFKVNTRKRYNRDWDLESDLKKIAAKKLSVSPSNVRLGQYAREPFDQGHLPWHLYQEGKWVSRTVD